MPVGGWLGPLANALIPQNPSMQPFGPWTPISTAAPSSIGDAFAAPELGQMTVAGLPTTGGKGSTLPPPTMGGDKGSVIPPTAAPMAGDPVATTPTTDVTAGQGQVPMAGGFGDLLAPTPVAPTPVVPPMNILPVNPSPPPRDFTKWPYNEGPRGPAAPYRDKGSNIPKQPIPTAGGPLVR